MGVSKWIGGALGFILGGGPLGALLGYFLGSLIDNASEARASEGEQGGYNTSSNSSYTAQRNSFLFSLLVLSSYIIKADKKVLQSELNYVREFIRQNFGDGALPQAMPILDKLLQQDFDVQGVGRQIAANMDYAQRLQLLNYLLGIAKADGNVSAEEIVALKLVAFSMNISAADVESMLNLGKDSLESAYKVLGINEMATDAELRKAYRNMVLKHHPDKVATLGPEIQKAAEEKLKKVNAAYEKICKARGIS